MLFYAHIRLFLNEIVESKLSERDMVNTHALVMHTTNDFDRFGNEFSFGLLYVVATFDCEFIGVRMYVNRCAIQICVDQNNNCAALAPENELCE